MHTRTPSKFEEKFAKKWKKKLARNRSNAKEKLKKKEEEAKMYKVSCWVVALNLSSGAAGSGGVRFFFLRVDENSDSRLFGVWCVNNDSWL